MRTAPTSRINLHRRRSAQGLPSNKRGNGQSIAPNAIAQANMDKQRKNFLAGATGHMGSPQYQRQTTFSNDTMDTTGIEDRFREQLMNALTDQSAPQRTPDAQINQSAGEIAANEASAASMLQQNAAMDGFGTSGAEQAGLQNIFNQFAALKSDSANDITANVDEMNRQAAMAEQQRMLQSLGLAGQTIAQNQQFNLAQSEMEMRMQQQQQANAQRNASIAAARQPQQRPNIVVPYAGFNKQQQQTRGSNAPSNMFAAARLNVGGNQQSTRVANNKQSFFNQPAQLNPLRGAFAARAGRG